MDLLVKMLAPENEAEKEKKEASIHVHDPFEKGNDKEITKEDLENVQKFKEASTERD